MCFGSGGGKSNGTEPAANLPRTSNTGSDAQRQQVAASGSVAPRQTSGLLAPETESNKKSVLGSY